MQNSKILKFPSIIILFAAIIAYWPIVFFVYTFKWDMLDVVFPFRYFAGECIQNGVFPLWNPYLLTGSPVYADLQYPLWSPEVWLTGLTTGYNIYILHIIFIFYIFLAGYGMYRLVKHFTGNRTASLVTGISYMLSGFFVGHGQALFSIIGASFLPWIVLYMIKNLNKPSLSHAIKLALFIFLQITTGYQAITLLTGYLLLFMFLYYLVKHIKNRRNFITLVKFNALLFILVLLLSMVIIVPVIQVYGFNDRIGSGLTYYQAKLYSFTFNCLISLVSPFSTVKNPDFFNTDISMRNIHLGLLMLMVFFITFFKKKSGLEYLLLIFGFICLLASFGDGLPVHKLLYRYFPLMNRLRMPAYFNLFVIFAILFSTGIRLSDLLIRMKSYRKVLTKALLCATGIITLLFVFSVFHINFRETVLRKIPHQPWLIPDSLTFYEHTAIQVFCQIILCTVILFSLIKKALNKYIGVILPGVMIFEMVLAVNLNNYYTVNSITKPQEINSYMKNQPRGFPVPDNQSIIENSDSNLTFSPLWRNMGILTKRVSFDGFSSFILKSYNYLNDSIPRLKDSLLNNPLVYFSGNVERAENSEDKNSPYDRDVIYLNDSVYYKLPGILKRDSHAKKIDILSFGPDEIKVRYELDTAAIITCMQANYPGWQIKIDDREVPVFTSNYMYLSALAPSGKHTVVFSYSNPVVIVSFCISYAVLILLLVLLLYLDFRSRSAFRARLLPVLILALFSLALITFLKRPGVHQNKEKTYKEFSNSLAAWEKVFSIDSLHGIFNLDDTVRFNELLAEKEKEGIKYTRFNHTEDLGEFYRQMSATKSGYFVYGYFNMLNPIGTDKMIRSFFPYKEQQVKSSLGKMTLYARTGSDVSNGIIFRSLNDFESSLPRWTPPSGEPNDSLTTMGNVYERMDSTKLFSSTFHEKIKNISQGKDLNLVITADVFLYENANPLLVYEEKKGEHTKKWISLDVRKFVRYSDQWTKVFFEVEIDKNHMQKDVMGIYFWNIDNGNFLIDNFKIEGYWRD